MLDIRFLTSLYCMGLIFLYKNPVNSIFFYTIANACYTNMGFLLI